MKPSPSEARSNHRKPILDPGDAWSVVRIACRDWYFEGESDEATAVLRESIMRALIAEFRDDADKSAQAIIESGIEWPAWGNWTEGLDR